MGRCSTGRVRFAHSKSLKFVCLVTCRDPKVLLGNFCYLAHCKANVVLIVRFVMLGKQNLELIARMSGVPRYLLLYLSRIINLYLRGRAGSLLCLQERLSLSLQGYY
jgi:hypothetical protein